MVITGVIRGGRQSLQDQKRLSDHDREGHVTMEMESQKVMWWQKQRLERDLKLKC